MPTPLLFLCLTALLVSAAPARALADDKSHPAMNGREMAVFEALNELRSSPQSFVAPLEEMSGKFEGKYLLAAPRTKQVTQEGVSAVKDAIQFLKKKTSVGKLAVSEILIQTARELQNEQKSSGRTGHFGAKGSTPELRLRHYAISLGKIGENITYGKYWRGSPRDVILALVVDDGVPDRGHRKIFFDPDLKWVGIACGSHPQFEQMCVMDFASEIRPK